MEVKKEKEIESLNNWDTITKWILGISIFFIIFSFVAPVLFVSKAISPKLDFSETGPVGDTIGGIMNPFIALVGILLTFLAFYMQIKANEQQRQLFLDGLAAEKKKEEDVEKKDARYKLNLLAIDLENITSDITQKALSIKDYFEAERDKPFDANILYRTPSNKLTRISDLDRLSIYKSFKLFLSSDDKWLKSFNNLYSTLDYLPLFFEQLYRMFDNHSRIKFEQKKEVTELLLKLNEDGSKILTAYKDEQNANDYLNFPASSSINELIAKYYEIIDESVDENGNFKSETDFDKFSNDMLLPFISNVLDQREDIENFDRRIEPLGQLASSIRKKIYLIEQESLKFSGEVEKEYNLLMEDSDESKCTATVIKGIYEFISNGLQEGK
ncbi:hypothetical protein [uncultured Maribacter sp.]|uniref:hypothetical protein n=1 Tax=uncultured Maribacter sp. TaxID=431308 RepID=UPI0030DA0A95|tara:strand:- start:771 stop:1925 length:1155 start_codon:yes stop_codon:yes gene_type:complete